jgi:hypothetical protein
MKSFFLYSVILIFSTQILKSQEVFDMETKQFERDELICILAGNDAVTYHGKNELHFALGFFIGPPGIIYSQFKSYGLSKRTQLISENKDSFENPVYFDCYTQTVKKRLFLMSVLGWISSTFILISLVIIMRYFY